MGDFNGADPGAWARNGPTAQIRFTGAEHAMFAEMLLMDPGYHRYRAVADRIAAAVAHTQLAHVLLLAAQHVHQDYDVAGISYEWARALPVRGPVDSTDVALDAVLRAAQPCPGGNQDGRQGEST